jgi:RimJ/RimL family protein N-acetyltransferase
MSAAWIRCLDELAPLEGRVVRLEPLALSHRDALCEVGLDEEIWRLGLSQLRTPDDMAQYIQSALSLRNAHTAYPFATIERSSGRVVGSTRFANMDAAHRRLEIGWTWIGRPWQRTAVNTEAKYLMLRAAFEQLGCNRVEFKTDVLNERSRAALLRIGATEEGILRHHMVTAAGRIRDSIYYSILASEWPPVRQALEEKLALMAK